MNRAYVEGMGNHRPARTVIGVNELPKPGGTVNHEFDGRYKRVTIKSAIFFRGLPVTISQPSSMSYFSWSRAAL